MEAAANAASAGGSSAKARTGRRHAVPVAAAPSSRIVSDRASRYHAQRLIGPSRATTFPAPMTCRSPSAESASAHPVPSTGVPWPAITCGVPAAGSVAWTKAQKLTSRLRSTPASAMSTQEPLRIASRLPGLRPSIADGTTRCLKPGPLGLVSPWMSRTSRTS